MKNLTLCALFALAACLPVLGQDLPPPSVSHHGSVVGAKDAQTETVSGTLTLDGDSLMFVVGGKTYAVIGRLAGTLERHAANRSVTLKGQRTANGFNATAIRAVTNASTEVTDDQPIGALSKGTEVWVSGGLTYVEISSASKEGTVAASDLHFGPSIGVTVTLSGRFTHDLPQDQGDPDEGPMFTVDGKAMPVVGRLAGTLERHARDRFVTLKGQRTAKGFHATAIRATALKTTEVKDDQPVGFLNSGDAVWVTGGLTYVDIDSPEGTVAASDLAFGERIGATLTLSGLLTHDGEDDPVEAAPMFTVDGKAMPIVGPLVGLLRERARNRTVTLKGQRTAEGFKATAIHAIVAERTEVKDDQPIGYLEAGDEVWVTGGRVYVEITSASKEGTVAASDLTFGERPSQGVIDAIRDED